MLVHHPTCAPSWKSQWKIQPWMIKQWIKQGCVPICNSSWNIQSCVMMSWWTPPGNITVCTQSTIQGCVIIYNDKTSTISNNQWTIKMSSTTYAQLLNHQRLPQIVMVNQSKLHHCQQWIIQGYKTTYNKQDSGWKRHHIMWHPDAGNLLYTWWKYSHEFWCSSYTVHSVLTVFDSPKVGFHKLYSYYICLVNNERIR